MYPTLCYGYVSQSTQAKHQAELLITKACYPWQAEKRMFMYQKNIDFISLVEHTCSTLTLSHLTVKEKYKDYPVCLIQYKEKGNHLDYVEVSFDKENASLTFIMNKEDKCVSGSIHFYEPKDETLFIIFLRKFSKYYTYRKKCWILKEGFYVKLNEDEDSGTHFCFYKL